MEEQLENLKSPHINVSQHQQAFRVTLLNTRKSAYAGILFLILPLLFLSGVIFKHYLQIDLGILTSVYVWIGEVDRKFGDNSVLNWIIRLLLLFGPVIAVGINLLSITHVRYEKATQEVVLSFKLKWLNIGIILISGLFFSIFFLYLVAENSG